MSESGTVTLGITVAHRLRRNRKITMITRPTVRIRVSSTSLTEARIVCVRSVTTAMSIAGGIEAWMRGNAALMCSTVSMMLTPG